MVKSIYFKKFSNAMDILKGAHLGGSRGAHAPLLFLPLPEIIAIRALIFLPRPKIIYISAPSLFSPDGCQWIYYLPF